jgi:hypothetical protein
MPALELGNYRLGSRAGPRSRANVADHDSQIKCQELRQVLKVCANSQINRKANLLKSLEMHSYI